MRAEIVVSHKQGDITTLLTNLYKSHDQKALEASVLWQKSPSTAQSIAYAARTRGLIVMAEKAGDQGAVVYVESTGGRLRNGAVEVWSEIRKSKVLKTKLDRLVLFDEAASEEIAKAVTGISASLGREEFFVPIVTGIVTALVLGGVAEFGNGSDDVIYGSIPALGVAILSMIRLVAQSRSKALVWR